MDVPEDYNIKKERQDAAITLNEKYAETHQAFQNSAQLERIGTPIPVTDTRLRYDVTLPGVRTVQCKHDYYKSCPEAWIHAVESVSHKRPYCRTELFSEPNYRPKDPNMRRVTG